MKNNSVIPNERSLTTEKIEQAQNERLTNKFLTVDDVSILLQVPKSWVYEKSRRNEIPHKKIGKYLRFDRTEIMDWMDQSSSSLKNSKKRRL